MVKLRNIIFYLAIQAHFIEIMPSMAPVGGYLLLERKGGRWIVTSIIMDAHGWVCMYEASWLVIH